MASLIKRGKVWYAAYYAGHNGFLKKKWVKLSPDKTMAQVRFGELVNDLESQKYQYPRKKDISWKSFCEKYLAYSKTNKKLSTYETDKSTIERFSNWFGMKSVADLTPVLLEQYKEKRKSAGVKESTINRDLDVLKALSRKANEWGYIRENKMNVVKKLRLEKRRPVFFEEGEIKQIREKIYDQLELVMIDLALYTGMRREEISYLTWNDIDFNKKILRVSGKNGWTPKDYEEREIPIHPKLEKTLLAWRRQSGPCDYVLSIQGNRQATSEYLGKVFKRILKRAEIKGSFHSLRHTFASHLAMKDINLKKIAILMGHSSVQTTEIYAHLQPSSLNQCVGLLNY